MNPETLRILDSIARDLIPLLHHVAQMDSDPKLQIWVIAYGGLDRQGTVRRENGARKGDEHLIPRGIDEVALELLSQHPHDRAMSVSNLDRLRLVLLH